MLNEIQKNVQAQFGVSSESYATSLIHARGESLKVLVQLTNPKSDWCVLDVATGAGHTALAFAPYVDHVIAVDITQAMLTKTAELAYANYLANIEPRWGEAEKLPFKAKKFDLVTCRLGFHHFAEPQQALHEFARVLKPGGLVGFADNTTLCDTQAAKYYNAFERLRDPSHQWVYSRPQLEAMFREAGFRIEATRHLSKDVEFYNWADRQNVSSENKERLLEMMRQAPSALESLFVPQWVKGTLYFSLWETVIIGRLPQNYIH